MAHSEAELIDRLRELADNLGRTPTQADINEHTPHSAKTYYRKFDGGLNEARERAGLDARESGGREPEYTEAELIDAVQAVGDDLDKRPTQAEFREHGAVLRTITVDGEQLTVGVELPASRSLREFTKMFESRFPGATLVARREHDRPIQTVQGLRDEITEALTDRQLEALKTAYYSGFFEWPRDSSGQEVAAILDVSQPTFNRHLRATEQKLFAALFANSG